MNRTTRIWILLTLCAVAVGCADVSVSVDPSEGREFPSLKKNEKPEAINDNNKPENLGLPIDRVYDESLSVGTLVTVDHIPYPGNWFAQWNDGINYRWQVTSGTNLETLTDEQRRDMLSPAEKYDLAFNGWTIPEGFWALKPLKKPGDEFDKEYYTKIGPAADWEHKNSGHYKAINEQDDDGDGEIDEKDNSGRYDGLENWFGHCNGWSSAALNEREPKRPVTLNGVKFQVSDIKALLAELYFSDKSTFSGIRCESRPGALRKDETGRWLDAWLDFGASVLKSDAATLPQNEEKVYEITVENVANLKISITGDGDADLYVKKDVKPTTSSYDCRPYKDGSDESCEFANANGTYHIVVRGYATTSDIKLKIEKAGRLLEIMDYSGPYWADTAHTKIKYTNVKFTDLEGVTRTGEVVLTKSEYNDWSKDAKEGELTVNGTTQTTTFGFARGCRDLNPATIYLAMTQILGKYKMGVVIDVSADYEVWNYPVYKYRINKQEIVTKEKANELLNVDRELPYKYNDKATKFANVEMDIWYVSDSISPRTTPALAQVDQYTSKQTLTFVLELNDANEILGGEYTGDSRYRHPDFVWVPQGYSDNGAITKGTFVSFNDDKGDSDNPHLAFSNAKRLAMESSKGDDEQFKERDVTTVKTIAANGTTTSTLAISEPGALKQIAVKLDISGVALNALKLTLVSPTGTEIVLLDNNGSGSSLVGLAVARPWVHDGQLEIGLNKLIDESIAGTWTLKLQNARNYTGKLNSWGVLYTYVPGPGVTCQPDSCGGHGSCSVAENAIVCACQPGYAGSDCSTCASGYHLEGTSCVVDDNTQPTSFNASGTVAKDVEKHFEIDLPANAKNVKVVISGTGDADLYTNFGSKPTTSTFACRPYAYGSSETCLHPLPSGKLYIMVRGWDPTSDFSLSVTWEVGDGTPSNAVTLNETFEVKKDEDKRFVLSVGPTPRTVVVQLSGDGDADLYVRKGTAPTTSAYDCRPYLWGSVEACTLENVTGDLHINVRGYDPTSSVQLSAIAQ